MKKIHYLILASAAVITVACAKSAPVEQGVPELPDEGITVPEAVRFGSNVVNVALTKAAGSLDSWSDTQKLYVFGYNRTTTSFVQPNTFIDNVEAVAPNGVTAGVIDVVRPGTESEPFYYLGNNCYDFYGYYVDDAAVPSTDVVYSEANVSIPITLTGSEDIMLAKADQSKDIEGKDVQYQEWAYSAYAARRQVQPTLLFKHQLARFKFELLQGSSSETSVKVNVSELSLEAASKADLVVVAATDEERGIKNASTPAVFTLKERNQETNVLQELTPTAPSSAIDPTALGESIMVIPAASYKMNIKLVATEGTQTIPDVEYTLTPDLIAENLSAFEAGKSYKITIKIYGMEKVVITASLEDWQDGGNIIIDEDELPVPQA